MTLAILYDVVLNQVLVSFGAPDVTGRVIDAVWQAKTAMRISVCGWKTTDADVEKGIAAVARIARQTAQTVRLCFPTRRLRSSSPPSPSLHPFAGPRHAPIRNSPRRLPQPTVGNLLAATRRGRPRGLATGSGELAGSLHEPHRTASARGCL